MADLSISERSKKQDNAVLFDKTIALSEMYYNTPVSERLGFLSDLVVEARNGNTELRLLLSNQYLRRPAPGPLRDRMKRHRIPVTVVNAAHEFCIKLWGAPTKDVVYGLVPEPETGEF